MKTICLNMIVKNESAVIRRCLASVKPIIDRWVIVDTGSTDGTQNIIREMLEGIPGELHERPWVDFGHNRNEALDLARNKSDYILFIDADEELLLSQPLNKESLNQPAYLTLLIGKIVDGYRALLINNHPGWFWEGALHEYISNPDIPFEYHLTGTSIDVRLEGGFRSLEPKKYRNDAKMLKKSLKADPDNPRNVFYLAQSLRNAGKFRQALKAYQQRASMQGWKEEIFWSLYTIGILQDGLNKDPDTIIKSFSDAYRFDPERAEPLLALSNFHHRQGQFLPAYFAAKWGLTLPLPQNKMFLSPTVYEYEMLLRTAEAAYYIGQEKESYEHYCELLKKPNLPRDIRNLAEDNAAEIKELLKKKS